MVDKSTDLLSLWKKTLGLDNIDISPIDRELVIYFPEDDNYNGPLLSNFDLTWKVGNGFWDISIEKPYYSSQCY